MHKNLAMANPFPDQRLVILAREVAMEIHPIEAILERFGVSLDEWEMIKAKPMFCSFLQDAMITWNNALSGSERIKVKALAAVEDWLVEAYAILHDKQSALRDRVELAKLMSRLAGVGEKTGGEVSSGERISITINMGEDHKLQVEKIHAPKILEHQDVS